VDLTPGYRELPPPAWLRGPLSCLWVHVGPLDRSSLTLVLPDASTDLIWQQDRDAFLAGPDTGPVPTVMEAGSVMVGARFRPGAGGTVLGLPLAEVLDQRVDATEIPGLDARRLPGSLPPGHAMAELARLIADLARQRPADPVMTQAARLLGRPGSRADQIAGWADLSERQFRRRCQASAGYGPQMLQRVLRFRRFVSAVDSGPLPPGGLAQAAVQAGYADQPHLTRECARLAGLTPRALAAARAG
jgi:AraC-like DNA-binding protein